MSALSEDRTLTATPATSAVHVPQRARQMPTVRPNAFAAPLGLLGLASVWRAAAQLYGWQRRVAGAICLVAAFPKRTLPVVEQRALCPGVNPRVFAPPRSRIAKRNSDDQHGGQQRQDDG
jgi:hypothetical protein